MASENPAALLRVALKAAGFTRQLVSVRCDHSTLRVTVRSIDVPLSAVESIAKRFRSVSRCERTGEILAGGNTFVDVAYLVDLVEPIAAVVAALLAPAADGEIVELAGGFAAVKLSRAMGATYADEVRISGPGFDERSAIACGLAFAAKRIAIAYLDARARAQTAAAVEG